MNAPETPRPGGPETPRASLAASPVGPPAGETSLRSRRLPVAVVTVMGVCLLAGLVPRWREGARVRAETAELAIPTVLVTSPVPGRAPSGLPLSAEIKPWSEAPIYARANGYLKRWLVDLGAQVQAGQLLAEIDTPELNQELARARAELAQAEAALALSTTTAARWAELLKTASVSEQEASEKQADLALKRALVDGARANVRRLEELEGFSRVTAPFAGVVTARRTDIGELVSAAAGKELFRLAQTATLRVYVRVPQALAARVKTGQKAELTLAEFPGRVFTAAVARTAGAIELSSRTLLVELELDNTKGEILSGSFAQARFPESRPEAVLTLPSNVLLFRAEGLQVGVVRSDGRVRLQRVVLGRDFGATVEVLSGVSPSDRVLLNPADSLADGVAVRVVAPASPAASGTGASK